MGVMGLLVIRDSVLLLTGTVTTRVWSIVAAIARMENSRTQRLKHVFIRHHVL
jgi:hypothetical protein